MGNDVTDEQAKWRDDAIMARNLLRLLNAVCEWRLAPAMSRPEYLAGASADGSERER